MISIFYLTSNFNDVCLPEEADIHYFKLLNKRRVSRCLCSARSSECPRTSSASLLVCASECFAIVPSLLSITSLSKQNRIQTCCLASRQSLQGAHCEQACVCVWIHLSVELCSCQTLNSQWDYLNTVKARRQSVRCPCNVRNMWRHNALVSNHSTVHHLHTRHKSHAVKCSISLREVRAEAAETKRAFCPHSRDLKLV